MNAFINQIQNSQRAGHRSPEIKPLIDLILHRYPTGVLAVFLYGSCRQTPDPSQGLVDLCVIVDDYKTVHRNSISAFLNAALPPNVYFITTGSLRAKYILVSQRDFEKKMGGFLDQYFWARFSQPFTLVYSIGPDIGLWLAQTQMTGLTNFYCQTAPINPYPDDPIKFWTFALKKTYGCELRPESSEHALRLIAQDPSYWSMASEHLVNRGPATKAQRWLYSWGWHARKVTGKLMNLLRLMKAASTVSQGIDYIAWKMKRHSGVELEINNWMRRYPRLAGLALAWRAYRLGGFR